MDFTPLGDSALLMRLVEEWADEPEATIDLVLSAYRRIEEAKIPGVIEAAPAYTTVAVYFDPILLRASTGGHSDLHAWLASEIRRVLEKGTPKAELAAPGKTVELPVCYGGEFGPDLEEVARRAGLSSAEVVSSHTAGTYLVHCLGFTAGFPYLSGLAPVLATPRRSVPRKLVPAGSVGIGGAQTGVYPVASPGGWHLLGQTPRALFAPTGNPPALLEAGDRVRFVPISAEEFQQWREP